MQVQVTGIHIDIGEALREHVIATLESGVGKYFDRPVDGKVVFSKEGHEFAADCSVHLSSGMTLQTEARAGDIYASFDGAIERLEKRLRRYKRRLKNHHNGNKSDLPALEVSSFVLQAEDEGGEEPDDLGPVIIAEESQSVPTLSVGEAVMQMDISDAPVVMFRNASHGGLNVVYRRPDGHIGWIDPEAAAKKTRAT